MSRLAMSERSSKYRTGHLPEEEAWDSGGALSRYASLIPVNILTGFLGSGKTTLLSRLLNSPEMAKTAVIINEFGEVGLDHLLVREVDDETVVLQNGCVCCTIRSDLSDAILSLQEKSSRGNIPAFDRLVVETTGLADPAPIVSTLINQPIIRYHFRLGSIITTIDAVNMDIHLNNHEETAKQLAIADKIVITKTDLMPDLPLAAVKRLLTAINQAAQFFEATQSPSANELLAADLHNPLSNQEQVRSWLDAPSSDDHQEKHNHQDVNRHGTNIETFTLTANRPMDWTGFGLWLLMLLHAHGENVLRVKGILNVINHPLPLVIHGVQHMIHPPAHLNAWPGNDRSSRIIFITHDMDRSRLEASFQSFMDLQEAISPS